MRLEKKFINIDKLVNDISKKFELEKRSMSTQINAKCPYCVDSGYHLGLSISLNRYNCFRCPTKGVLTDLLTKFDIPFKTSDGISTSTIFIEDNSIFKNEPKKIDMPKDYSVTEKGMTEFKEFLKSRGVDFDLATKEFKMYPITNEDVEWSFGGKNSPMYGYCVLPINDYAFYGRLYVNGDNLVPYRPKHIIRKSASEVPLYYFYDKHKSNKILVVESVFNMVKAAMFGYSSVCIFGKVNANNLINFLKKEDVSDRTLLYAFDSDVTIKEVEDFSARISKKYRITSSYIPPEEMPCNDIADMESKEQLDCVVDKAKRVDDMFITKIKKTLEAFNVTTR